jgi:hypothetical protein
MQSRSILNQLSIFTRATVIMITLFILASLVVSTVFAIETTSSSPSVASTPGKSWANISYSFASDNLYALAKKPNKQLRLSKFNIPGIPGGATIDGIAVTVEGFTAGLQANVALSYDGGSNYTSAFTTALTASETVNTLGGPTNTWGRAWTAGNFTNNNFVVKLTTTGATGNGTTISVDQVQVKVYYTRPSTTLTLPSVSGPYSGTTSMTATLTLTVDGSPIPSKLINFYIGGTGIDNSGNCTGTFVGSATTQAGTGVATLANASLAGVSAGDYPYGACASFAGDVTYQGTSLSGDLQIIGTGTTLTVASATGTYGGTVNLSATLTLTSGGSPVNNELINFYLFGNLLGSSKTNGSGVATLSNASLFGYDAGASNDIGASFDGDANLNPANASALITINQRPMTVTAVANTKVYDGTTSSTGVPHITSGSLVTDDLANFIQTFDNKDVGTGKTLTPSGSVDDGNSGLNYTVSFVPVTTGVINKTSLTVTANDQSINAGEPDPAFTFSYSGFVNGETAAVVNNAPTCGVSVPHADPGTYPIVCSGGLDDNYNFSYVNGTLSVGFTGGLGDGDDTTGVFRPSNGLLYLKNSNDTGFADVALNYGLPGDYPVVGDWDGNGTVTIGIYRGNTFYLRNENTLGFATIVFDFGQVGDQPIAGDWDGDGIDTIGVFRPSNAQFMLRNSNDTGPAEATFYLGNPGDVGIAGDWNGDGIDSTGVFRPSNGIIFLKDTNVTGFANYALNYGLPGDKPVMGDWNNDGVDTIGIYRNGLFYLRNENTNGFAEMIFGLGNPGDMPIAGNWDGLP